MSLYEMNNYISGEAVAVGLAIIATTTVGILLGQKENNVDAETEIIEEQAADVDQPVTTATPPVKEVVADEPSLCDESVKTAELTVATQEESVPEYAEKVKKTRGIRLWKPKLLRKKIQLEKKQDDMLYTFKHR
jgi:hypothetical protein